MNATVKTFLINAAKNAVNAALTALGPLTAWSTQFNFNNWSGVKHVLLIMGSAAISRELMVYIPQLFAWSSKTDQP